jgi:hypothetical protein
VSERVDEFQPPDVEYDDEGPYCNCDLEPIEAECASMTCFACGKVLIVEPVRRKL